MNGLEGWLTTKRIGRDDEAIIAARQQAEAERRTKRGLGPAKQKAKGGRKQQPPTNKAAKKRRSQRRKKLEIEDSDSEEFFDEDEADEDEEEESSEDEDDFSDADDDDEPLEVDDDDSDEEDGGSSFLPSSSRFGKKQPRVKSMMEHSQRLKARNKRVGRFGGYSNNKVSLSDDSDSDEVLTDPTPRKKRASKPPAAAKKKWSPLPSPGDILASDDEDDDDELEIVGGKTSKFFNGKKKRAKCSSSDDDDKDDTPVRVRPKSHKYRTRKKRVLNEDSDDGYDDGDANYQKALKQATLESLKDQKSEPEPTPPGDFDDSDEDFQMAVNHAIAKSKQDKTSRPKAQKRLQKKTKGITSGSKKVKRNNQTKDESTLASEDAFIDTDDEPESMKVDEGNNENEIVNIEDSSSSSEDEGPEDDQEEYVDEEAREASAILATANELSANVLRIMTSWAGGKNKDPSGENETPLVPQGMIVDGAVAMSSLKSNGPSSEAKGNDKADDQSNKHRWISNETMKEILPTVTLPEYQLLGINWLAMLHSMTCTLKNRKNGKKRKPQKTNVNGVLADEMGLGKTCQTIAFLAWLKYAREKGELGEENEIVFKTGDQLEDDDGDDDGDGILSDKENDVDDREVIQIDDGDEQEYDRVSMRDKDKQKPPETCLPHLIVVPASVVSNWEREFETFAPNLHVVTYHGTMDEREEIQNELRRYHPKTRDRSVPMIDVILTSITYFQKEKSDDRDFLRKFQFDYMVIDEGHMLKNAKGLRYSNLDRFRTRHRLLLTGTPVQNSPKELMALLCFLMPLFSRKGNGFDESSSNDGGEAMLQHFVQLEENAASKDFHSSEASAYSKLKQLFAPFVLRRKKQDVLSQILPPKIYQVERVDLDERARKVYDEIIADHLKAKKNKTARATDHLFTALRKAANHPLLLRSRYKTPEEMDHMAEWFHKCGAFRGEASSKERVASELEGFSDFEIHLTALDLLEEYPHYRNELDRYVLSQDDLFCSAKFVKLRGLLPQLIADGHRILIFSVWTKLLDLLSCLVDTLNLNYRRMDGQTPVAERQNFIDEFNRDDSIKVFLLSTKACGLGINCKLLKLFFTWV